MVKIDLTPQQVDQVMREAGTAPSEPAPTVPLQPAAPEYTREQLAAKVTDSSARMQKWDAERRRLEALDERSIEFHSERSKQMYPPHGAFTPESTVIKKQKIAAANAEYDSAFLENQWAMRQLFGG